MNEVKLVQGHEWMDTNDGFQICQCGAQKYSDGEIIKDHVLEKKFDKDPLFSFIIPVHKVPRSVVQRCLMSVTDQDYPELEIICVVNGDVDGEGGAARYKDQEVIEAHSVCLDFAAKFPNVRVITLPEGNACVARNIGFQESKGEIVSFFNSDYIAKPGMVRNWVTALRDHPDCGFVYGAYEYSSNERAWYPSKPFDPFQLRIANYIDCGFPLWRKYVVPWDPECKSLQDWDFWIRVVHQSGVKDLVKGHYLGSEISYMAEPPRSGGLSVDSSTNWVDRVHYIKAKNGIKEPDICVCSVGAPIHGMEIAKMLGADFRDDTIFKPHAYKALYLIGWYMKPSDQGNAHPQILNHFRDSARIVHFVGADIFWLRKFPHDQLKYLTGALKLRSTKILCENAQSQKELADMGIPAEIVPIPSYNTWEIKPLPEKFRLAIFLTQRSDFDKYCYEETLSIVRAMPDVEFAAYGDGGWDVDYPNMIHFKNMDRENWQKFVYGCSAYFRIVRHDTMPMASNEFVMAGRDTITNVPAPYMEIIDTGGKIELNEWDIFGSGLNPWNWPDTKKAIVQRIRAVRDGKAGNLTCREEAAAHWRGVLDREAYIAKIKNLVEEYHEKHNVSIAAAREPAGSAV